MNEQRNVNVSEVQPVTVSLYPLDPDFRKLPQTERYCIICQRDLPESSKALRVQADHIGGDLEDIRLSINPNGNAFVGTGYCARKLRQALAAQRATNA
jgi:hypothetical protein